MTAVKVPNYSTAQVALIVAAIEANDGIADISVATELAENPAMNTADGDKRKARSIVAKMRRIVDTVEGFSYARKVATTKDGRPVQKKVDLVNRIASLADVSAAKLDGLDKAPKLALETLAAAFAA